MRVPPGSGGCPGPAAGFSAGLTGRVVTGEGSGGLRRGAVPQPL